MVCYPRLLLLLIGGLAHMGRCFLNGPAAAAVYTRQHPGRKAAARHRRRHVPLFSKAAASRTPHTAAAAGQAVPQPLFIAVLRDVQLERAGEVARALYRGGFRMLSVTTNTPNFTKILQSIATAADTGLTGLTVGASSVCSEKEVGECSDYP